MFCEESRKIQGENRMHENSSMAETKKKRSRVWECVMKSGKQYIKPYENQKSRERMQIKGETGKWRKCMKRI